MESLPGWPARALLLLEPPRWLAGLTLLRLRLGRAPYLPCVYAEQRPVAPSGHAQPPGRRCEMQSCTHSCAHAILPKCSIKRLASYASHRWQIAAVVQWRLLSHPLPLKSDLSAFGPIMLSFPRNRHAACV
jgi:hypothetical protein